MECNCKVAETFLALVILAVTIWPMLLGAMTSKWVVIVVAVLLILHAWQCKSCDSHRTPAKKKR